MAPGPTGFVGERGGLQISPLGSAGLARAIIRDENIFKDPCRPAVLGNTVPNSTNHFENINITNKKRNVDLTAQWQMLHFTESTAFSLLQGLYIQYLLGCFQCCPSLP
ncbi:hypothetical protein CIHG_06251 [Coccidioides immitis H538.4]|uniref:Uncharacterized protein n=3 Tax=Coccidioides immitis TaxID=5501 RepID=A0A0J8QTB4_COCIT|nr:hypothetical protein CIRG_09528 [Coccidioides immitis RMSCC 2394]KMU75295.1 hypothetical protein CISG_04714 [Coccidioides immitis RMSCC 3703]KMU88451.1 hypothetical protein CIHG_06251 [Coccidioides immitis H538.4]